MSSPQAYESYDFSPADLNADGYLDLAFLRFNSLLIVLNDGHGHFLAPTTYPIPGMLSSALHLDLADHDGEILPKNAEAEEERARNEREVEHHRGRARMRMRA